MLICPEQTGIENIIKSWVQPESSKNSRGIAELLGTIHTILPDLVPAGGVSSSPLDLKTPPIDVRQLSRMYADIELIYIMYVMQVKKAYMKAVRYVHPDKTTLLTNLETKLIAQEVFIVISQKFELYKKAHEI